MEFYMNAFYELSTERKQAGLPIPWGSIDRYAERYGVDGSFYDVFVRVMRRMDRHCLDKAKAKA